MKNDDFRNFGGIRSVNPVQLPLRWYCILTVVSSPKNPQNRRWKSRHVLSVLCSYCSGDSFDVCCRWKRNTERRLFHGKKKKPHDLNPFPKRPSTSRSWESWNWLLEHAKHQLKRSFLLQLQDYQMPGDEEAHLVSRMSSDTARASQSGWRFLRSRRTRSACSPWWRGHSTNWGQIWHRFLPLWEAGRCSQLQRALRRKEAKKKNNKTLRVRNRLICT